MAHVPFRRAKAMFAEIAVVLAKFRGQPLALSAGLADIGPYESKRKSRGTHHSSRCVAQDKRDARDARNRKRNK